jgi:hypothetical protein
MKTRVAFTKTMQGRPGLVPLPGVGHAGKRRGTRAFLPFVPYGSARQKYEFNRCTRPSHPPVSRAHSTERFPRHPFRSGGPWHWKTVRPPTPSAYCGSGDVPKCPPRLR